MSLDFKKARQLCTDREFALVAAARRPAMSTLTPKRLQAHVEKTRSLRDKFRGLAREQKALASPARPRSLEKAALFDEVLARFESRLAKLQGVRSVGVPRSKTARVATLNVSAEEQHRKGKRTKLGSPRVKAQTLSRNRHAQPRRDAG